MRQASVGFHCPECTTKGAQKVIRPRDLIRRPVVTYTIMGLCVLAYMAQQGTQGTLEPVTESGSLLGRLVRDGEWWRIVTSGFLHGGLFHIASNMYALYVFGPMLEQALGRFRFALVYAGGLFGGSLAVLAFNFEKETLGASGAVLGLAGGLAALLAAQGRSIMSTSLGGIFALNLLLPLLIPRISFWGHFGGIAGGFVVAFVLASLPRTIRGPKGMQAAAAAAVAIVVVLGAAAVAVAMAGGIATIG